MNEHPQTVALVLAFLPPERAAQVLVNFVAEFQAEVARRIATMERASPDAVLQVERTLRQKFTGAAATGGLMAAVGGVPKLVQVLGSVDRGTEKNILDSLDETYPELADEIKKNQFVFADIVRLGDRDMQRVSREIDTRELALALRGASEQVRQKFFKNMSSRLGQSVREEMEIIGPTRLSAVEEAQQRIIAVIRRLEQAEEIVIPRGGQEKMV